MLKYLSTRNALCLLKCLQDSYDVACQFDSRPGLKFLVQKVARADVAANLYKQAGVAMTFYIHSLLEISARQDNISVENCRRLLSPDVASSTDSQTGSPCHVPKLDFDAAKFSLEPIHNHMPVFVNKLKTICDEICRKYIDMVLDVDDITKTDHCSQVPLFFLTAHIEELPKLKEDKNYGEELVKKYKKEKAAMQASESISGPLGVQAVTVQGLYRDLPFTMYTHRW